MKINTQIQNTVMGVCMRKPKASSGKDKSKSKNKTPALHFATKDHILGTLDLIKRTDYFYHKFAAETLENDIEKEKK